MKLFSLGIVLFSLFCYSCMDDRLEPVPGEERQAIPFSVNDAREFFENNATDLSPLSFTGTSLTRSEGRANVELNPEWDNAMISGHKGVTLIEIPLYSTSTVLVQEGIFKNKRLVGTRTTISGRRLIVAKRANGEVDMFVATIVPEARSIEDNLSEMLEDFRYLGGGSFSGKVFCSTLEGKFVKAFGYTDGKLNGRLNTRIRQASGESHPEDEEYSRLIFNETSSARASMFSGNESGGGGGIDYGKCEHGYTKGFCPHGCRAEVEEVEIITCRYCGTRNGCVCSRCFYCGNKEPECSCTRCTICRKKMQDCKCFEYPDPDPEWTCPRCGSQYCDGNCPTGGTGTGESPKKTPFLDKIYHPNSSLNDVQKKKLEQAIKEFTEKYPEFKEMYNNLVNKNKKLICKMDTKLLESLDAYAGYDAKTESLLFRADEFIREVYLQEELIHASQHLEFYGTEMDMSRKNVEFEAKIVQDMLMWKHIGYGADIGSVGHDNEFMSDYSRLLENYTIQGFHELCIRWKGYSGSYNPNFVPKVIQSYLKK